MEEPDNLEKKLIIADITANGQKQAPTWCVALHRQLHLKNPLQRRRAQRQQEGSPVWIHPGSPSLILAVLAHNRMMVVRVGCHHAASGYEILQLVPSRTVLIVVLAALTVSLVLGSGAAALCAFCRALGQLGSTQQDRPVILKPRCDQALALAGLDCRRLGDLIVGVAIPIGVGSAPVSSQRSTASVLTGRTA
ncbi:hypothetical protein FALBO_1252 [Fusarium albosuccineum]|uniref:Uncharacterized protein n=1 Tax=Fusarium albosuccineum TaxID=1237068 RepID=A0A8H4PM23_9HYPO|nr:hypothetical protein FALBO_1252 [Fusarium albosuccineum]